MDASVARDAEALMHSEQYFPPEVVEMFREAERKRKKPLVNWYAVLGIGLIIATATLFWWQVAKAL